MGPKADLLGGAQRCVTLSRDPHERSGGLVKRIRGALQLLLCSVPGRPRILRLLQGAEGSRLVNGAIAPSQPAPTARTERHLSTERRLSTAAWQEPLQRAADLLHRCAALLNHLLGNPLVRQGPLRVQARSLQQPPKPNGATESNTCGSLICCFTAQITDTMHWSGATDLALAQVLAHMCCTKQKSHARCGGASRRTSLLRRSSPRRASAAAAASESSCAEVDAACRLAASCSTSAATSAALAACSCTTGRRRVDQVLTNCTPPTPSMPIGSNPAVGMFMFTRSRCTYRSCT